MGGHKQSYPSLRWVGMDDERTARYARMARRGQIGFPPYLTPTRQSPSAILPALRMAYDGPADLTPRRGLVYDA